MEDVLENLQYRICTAVQSDEAACWHVGGAEDQYGQKHVAVSGFYNIIKLCAFVGLNYSSCTCSGRNGKCKI